MAVRTLADMPNSELPVGVVAAFIQLLLSAQLLFLVSHSRLLKMHSKILKEDLQIPAETNAEL